MVTRLLLFLLLSLLLSRAFWRIVGAFMEGLKGRDASTPMPPPQGVQMVRDPVCGTFVLPARAVSIVDGRTRLYFCSEACRDKYRARTA